MTRPDVTAYFGWVRLDGTWMLTCSGLSAVACWQILLTQAAPPRATRTVMPRGLRPQDGHCLHCGQPIRLHQRRRGWHGFSKTQTAHCSAACAYDRQRDAQNAADRLRRQKQKEAAS